MCVLIFFSTKLLNSNITSFLLKYWFVYQFIQGINWFFLHFWEYIALKGPTTVFLSDPPCKDGNSIWCLGWKPDYFYCRFSSSVTCTHFYYRKAYWNYLNHILLNLEKWYNIFFIIHQIKVSRVPLWIRHCNFCERVHLKLRLQSLREHICTIFSTL